MESFIDKLNSTLNAANKHNESEIEEIKDEIIEDLEEEALQAEVDDTFEDEETRKNTIINQVKTKVDYKQVKPNKANFYINKNNGAHSNDYDDDFDDDEENSDTLKRNTDSKEGVISNMIPIGTATNHMHNRINSLEK
jgi:hypothetical protein